MIESLRIASIILLGFVAGYMTRGLWRESAPVVPVEATAFEEWPARRCGDHGLRYLFLDVGKPTPDEAITSHAD